MTEDAAAATEERRERRTRARGEVDDADGDNAIAGECGAVAAAAVARDAATGGATAWDAAPRAEAPPARRGERREGAACI